MGQEVEKLDYAEYVELVCEFIRSSGDSSWSTIVDICWRVLNDGVRTEEEYYD